MSDPANTLALALLSDRRRRLEQAQALGLQREAVERERGDAFGSAMTQQVEAAGQERELRRRAVSERLQQRDEDARERAKAQLQARVDVQKAQIAADAMLEKQRAAGVAEKEKRDWETTGPGFKAKKDLAISGRSSFPIYDPRKTKIEGLKTLVAETSRHLNAFPPPKNFEPQELAKQRSAAAFAYRRALTQYATEIGAGSLEEAEDSLAQQDAEEPSAPPPGPATPKPVAPPKAGRSLDETFDILSGGRG